MITKFSPINFLSCLAFLIFACLPVEDSSADTVTIELTAVATGSLADQNFTNAPITITGIGDTDNVMVEGSANLLLEGLEVSVDIEGVGSAVFTDEMQAVSNNNSDLGGFGNTSTEFGLLLIFNDAFAEYDLTTGLDPVSGFGVIVIGVPHATTAGNLRLFDILGNATYSATVTQGCPFQTGDVNEDGEVDLLDVGPFVDALANAAFICQADINGDGSVDLLDVDGFVELLQN